MSALLLAAMLAPTAASPEAPVEIVVTARRAKCDVRLADRVLGDREFRERAKQWAEGVPVRVYAPRASDYKCLSKIVFRLQDANVRLIEFVDHPAEAVQR